MTVAELKTRTVKDLAALAKRKGVAGWHSMRKEELIQALLKRAKAETAKNGNSNGAVRKNGVKLNGSMETVPAPNGAAKSSVKLSGPHTPPKARISPRLRLIKAKLAQSQDLSTQGEPKEDVEARDRLVLMVRDSYWLHAYWELTRAGVERARAALAQYWHGARPVLRLAEVAREGSTSNVRKIVRDIEIHGGVSNWYIDVAEPPKSFQVEIGYLALDGRFLSLARSNVVTTPPAGTSGKGLDGNWADVVEDCDHIYAMSSGYEDETPSSDLKDLFEERLRRPIGNPLTTRYGLGASAVGAHRAHEFCFEVDAELVVFGIADPDAHVTFRGEPIKLQPDGTFAMRFNLPDRRQVLPIVAASRDGVEQRTIVLAVERNTKIMEPVIREPDA